MSTRKVRPKPKTPSRRRRDFRYVSSPERVDLLHALRHRLGYGSVRELIDRAVDVLTALSSHVAHDGTVQIVTPDGRTLICALGCPVPYDHLARGAHLLETYDDDDFEDSGPPSPQADLFVGEDASDKDVASEGDEGGVR